MATRSPRRPKADQSNVLILKPGGAVCVVKLPLRPLRIFFQRIPGETGLEEDRGIAGLAYKLRIPGQPEISGMTPANGKVELPGLRPGMVGELDILGARLWLRPCDYRADEATDGTTTMTIRGAKRRLMVAGYYDEPYHQDPVWGTPSPVPQVPDDTLHRTAVEDAILRFQVDSHLMPDGEIERQKIVGGRIDTSQQYGFHMRTADSTFGRFHPDFIELLAASGGSAPPDTMTPCVPAPRDPARPSGGRPAVLEREIYDDQCFVPVRFLRYVPPDKNGKPQLLPKFDPRYPDPDERGYLDRDGPVVSIMAGKAIELRLQRLHVDPNAMLALCSTDESVATVRMAEPVQGIVEVSGVSGQGERPGRALIEVRFGNVSGPVLHRLHVEVYDEIEVAVTVHFVAIGDRNNPATPPVVPSLKKARLEPLFKEFNDIWQAAGIRLTVKNWLHETIDLDQAGAMKEQDFTAVTSLNRVPRQMNIYVVEAMIGVGIGWGACNTAVVAAERMLGGQPSGVDALIQTFAHEFGHFFGLWHPGTVNARGDNGTVILSDGTTENHALEDYWSRRSLMYFATGLRSTTAPLDARTRQLGRQYDIGYGPGVGGRMLCCKVVAEIISTTSDSEVLTARSIALLNQGKPK